MTKPKIVLAVHGGAGALPRETMTPEREGSYHAELERALRIGFAELQRSGGTCVDAVEAAIRILEDSHFFNAGRGAAFSREGRIELDASIMEGRRRRAGSVAGLTRTKNPISAARAVMESTAHVMLIGDAADRFAKECGLASVDPIYFWTAERWESLLHILKEHSEPTATSLRGCGTVGAVALDRAGDLGAGASTGGTNGKRAGRVGDTPIIGSGTYAENGVVAVSCTGEGEFFIRLALAHEIIALMKYQGLPVDAAADRAIHTELATLGGQGGVIALDSGGNVAMPFNSNGMYRGSIDETGHVETGIY
jgi:L-asparaginase / beta-aspartyl-peptidase